MPPEEGGSFANFSSFAYWKDSELKGAGEQAAENIALLQDWEKLKGEKAKLKSGYVLLGVNAGLKGVDAKKAETFEHFEMFHVRSVPSPIKYKNAFIKTGNEEFYNEHVSGIYMTDFIKGFPTSYGPDIKKHLKEVQKKLKYSDAEYKELYTNFCKVFGEILVNELKALGGKTHTLIVMGKRKNLKDCLVNEFLRESGLDQQYTIVNVSHYSGSPSHVNLVEELKHIFSE